MVMRSVSFRQDVEDYLAFAEFVTRTGNDGRTTSSPVNEIGTKAMVIGVAVVVAVLLFGFARNTKIADLPAAVGVLALPIAIVTFLVWVFVLPRGTPSVDVSAIR